MTDFVLDNLVTMRWLLESGKRTDQHYAEQVLKCLVDTDTLVPNLWHLEVASVLLSAEKTKEIKPGESEAFIAQLENLPIYVDPITSHQAFSRTLGLARVYLLSSYDAAYLELAIREGLPLATLDKNLIKAAKKAGIGLFLRS